MVDAVAPGAEITVPASADRRAAGATPGPVVLEALREQVPARERREPCGAPRLAVGPPFSGETLREVGPKDVRAARPVAEQEGVSETIPVARVITAPLQARGGGRVARQIGGGAVLPGLIVATGRPFQARLGVA